MGLIHVIIAATDTEVRRAARSPILRIESIRGRGRDLKNDFHTTVRLLPWTSDWEKRFREERTVISSAFEKAGLPPAQIHHTGSTSIHGMWSKPIIDVLVIIQQDGDHRPVGFQGEDRGVEGTYCLAAVGTGYADQGVECHDDD